MIMHSFLTLQLLIHLNLQTFSAADEDVDLMQYISWHRLEELFGRWH